MARRHGETEGKAMPIDGRPSSVPPVSKNDLSLSVSMRRLRPGGHPSKYQQDMLFDSDDRLESVHLPQTERYAFHCSHVFFFLISTGLCMCRNSRTSPNIIWFTGTVLYNGYAFSSEEHAFVIGNKSRLFIWFVEYYCHTFDCKAQQ